MKQFYLKLSSLTVAVLMALLLVFSSMPVLAANENPAVDIEVPGAVNNKATMYLDIGETRTITYVLKDSNGDITTDPNAKVTPKIERQETDSGSGSVISPQDLNTFVVKGLAVGYASIRIDMETTENFRGTQWIDVYVANQNPESVKASTDSITLNLKTKEDYPVRNFFNGIAAVGEEDESFCDLTFSVADPSIAKVSDASPYWLTPLAVGSTKLTATARNGKSTTVDLIVVDENLAEDITVKGNREGMRVADISMKFGTDITLEYTLLPEGGNFSDEIVTWSVFSGDDVVEVDQNGKVTPKKSGFAQVKATTKLGDYAHWNITVTSDAPQAVTFDSSKNYDIDSSFNQNQGWLNDYFSVTPSTAGGAEFIFKSSDENVICFDNPNDANSVRIVGSGKATITITSALDPSISDSHDFEVIKSPLSDFRVDDVTLIEGQNMVPSRDQDGNEYLRYNIYGDQKFTIVYNGQTYSGNHMFIQQKLTELMGSFPGFNVYDNQYTEADVFKVGQTYPVTIELLGKSATFNATVVPATYKVTWKDYDGTVLSTETYSKGDTPTYKGTEPARTATGTDVYLFKGWTPEIEAVTADAEYTAEYETIQPEVAAPVVEVTGTITDEDKQILVDSLKDAGGLGVDETTLKDAIEIDAEDLQKKILDENIDPGTVSIETKFVIEARDVNKDSGQISLTMDITPKCVISYTKDGETKVLDEKPLTISEPVSMKVPVGSLFGTDTPDGTTIYVVHKQAIYNGTLVTEGTERYVEFDNPDGFSEFTFTTEDPAVIKIGEESYLTLQDAVDAVKDGETIKIVKAAEEALKATVAKEISFTVSIADEVELAKEDISLTAGDGYEMSVSEDKYTFTKKADPEPVYIPAEADYSKVDAALKKAEELDRELYTEESLKAVDDAAAAVTRGLYDYEQAKVDAMAAAIEDALAALEEKEPEIPDDTPADYSAVNDAIAKIPADLSIYTDESVAALEAALAGIEEGLTADEQAKVDEMAAALELAITGLEEKDQPQPEPVILEGWQLIEGGWYYFIKNVPQKGWLNTEDGWYYLDPNTGIRQYGWVYDGGFWYFLNGETGIMETGWVFDNGSWYLMDYSGRMMTGWAKVGDLWYFLKGNGAMAANEWIEGYWLGASGAWTYNAIGVWKQNSTGWWFEDTYGWYPVNTTVRIDYIDYTFNAAGYWVQ